MSLDTPTGMAALEVDAKVSCRPTATQTNSTASSPEIQLTSAAMRGRSGSLYKPSKTPPPTSRLTKYPMIHRSVLDACDANDGLKDGLIENPESCHIDDKDLQCKSVQTAPTA